MSSESSIPSKEIIERKRERYRHALSSSIEKIISELSVIPEVQKVILFGSYAKGRRDLFTDLDIIVVLETKKNVLERTLHLYQELSPSVDLDLLVYTPEEFSRLSRYGFLQQALRSGELLYEK